MPDNQQNPKSDKTQTDSSTFIRVKQDNEASPYVVDLKQDETTVEDIKAFREKMRANRRKKLDFAQMVRESNRSTKESRPKENIDYSKIEQKQQVKKDQSRQSSQKKYFVNRLLRYYKRWYQERKKQSRKIARWFSFHWDKIISSINYQRSAIGLVGILALVLLPFPVIGYYQDLQQDSKKVLSYSKNGFNSLKASTLATLSSDMRQAKSKLSNALSLLSQAEEILKKQHGKIITIAKKIPVVGSGIQAKQNLLAAGNHIALGNTYILKGINDAKNHTGNLLYKSETLNNHIKSALPQYKQALRSIVKVPTEEIPSRYRSQAQEFKLIFTAIVNDLENISSLLDAFRLVFGQSGYNKYLVLFQNSNELRPTGGFAGGFAVVETQKGKINWKIPSGGTYDLQGQLNSAIRPPKPLQLVNKRWQFQDANWWSHLPASAALIEDMYQEARGASVDGVITVNASVLKRLLKVTGPIKVEEYNITVTSKNVVSKIQKSEDIAQQKNKKAKSALSILAKKIRSRLKKKDKMALLKLAVEIYQALEQKEIQVYMDNKQTQETLRSFGWTGEIMQAHKKQDYLHITHANLGSLKSNKNINEYIDLSTSINDQGQVVNTLKITRKHEGKVNTNTPRRYSMQNFSYLRVYVPKGSNIISAQGFSSPLESAFRVPKSYYKKHPLAKSLSSESEIDIDSGTRIYNQFGKTVFSNWMNTKPQNTSTAVIKYELPFKLTTKSDGNNLKKWSRLFFRNKQNTLPYSMLIQKQSGTNYNFSHTISTPRKFTSEWKSTDGLISNKGATQYQNRLTTDLQYGVLYKK